MKIPIALLIAVGAVALAGGCRKKEPVAGTQAETPSASMADNGTELPKAASLEGLTYVKGSPVTFEGGKVYVVEFWATWCPPCRASIPHLTELQEHYKDITFIGISSESVDQVKPFVEGMGPKMDYTVAVDAAGKVNKGYMEAFHQNGIPTAFIIDGNGRVVWFGHPMAPDMEDVLTQLAAGQFDAAGYAKAKAEREAKEQKLRQLYGDYMRALVNGESQEELDAMSEQLLAVDDAQVLNSVSWMILTEIDDEHQDIKAALKFAEKAVELTESKEPIVLDTYALALFENDQVAEAVKNQTTALKIMADQDQQIPEDMQQRLEQFKKKLAESVL